MAGQSVLRQPSEGAANLTRRAARLSAGDAVRALVTPAGGVALLTVAFLGITVWWTLSDHRVPDADQSRHLLLSFNYYDYLMRGWELVPFRFEPSVGTIYPPLVHEIGVLGSLVAGKSVDGSVIALNVLLLPLLAAGIYGAGRFTHDPLTGLLAVAFAFGSPMLISQFHLFMLDMPLAAFVAASTWLLLRSDRFSNRRACLVAGVVIGLGMLVKQSFAFFLVPLVAVMIVRGGWRQWKNLILLALVAGVIGLPWYIEHFDRLRTVATEATAQVDNPVGDEAPRGSTENYLWYAWNLVNLQLYLPLTLFFLAGSVTAAVRWVRARRPDDYAPELLAGAVGGILAIGVVFGYHDPRYTFPAIVFVAVLATGWIARSRRALRVAAVVSLAAVVLVNTLAVNLGVFGSHTIVLSDKAPKSVAQENRLAVLVPFGYLVGKPERWGDVLAVMKAAKRDGITRAGWPAGGPLALDPGGLAVFGQMAGITGPVSEKDLGRSGMFMASRELQRGDPKPCAVLSPGLGLYLFRGDTRDEDPNSAKNVYCPPGVRAG